MKRGTVFNIQHMSIHDGPGIRTTVFLKGCPLRCAWCHNPETQKYTSEMLFYPNLCIGCGGCVDACTHHACSLTLEHRIHRENCVLCAECTQSCPTGALEICGEDMSLLDILSVVEKDRAFYGDMGGITLSGGEPLTRGETAIALLKCCKEQGLHTVVETCGYVDPNVLREAIPFVDLFLWDIKDTDEERHKKYTGVSNRKILDNLMLANEEGAKIRLRCILVQGVNTEVSHYRSIGMLAERLSDCEGVELIPYHAYGGAKAVFLGGKDNGQHEWIPSESHLEQAKRVLSEYRVHVF